MNRLRSFGLCTLVTLLLCLPAGAANRITNWGLSVVLTSAALNGEFNNIYSGAINRDGGNWGSLDDIPITFGSAQDVQIEWDTAQTNDLLMIGVTMGEGSCVMILDKADMATNFALAARTNPCLLVHSADATSANQYVEVQHNGTNGVINVGNGSLAIQIAGTEALLVGSSGLTFDAAPTIAVADAATNAASTLLTLTHTTSGTATTAYGSRIVWNLENGSGSTVAAAHIDAVWSDATAASEDADIVFRQIKAGTIAENFRVSSTGTLTVGAAGNIITTAGGGVNILAPSGQAVTLSSNGANPRWLVQSAGAFIPNDDNSYDIGITGTNDIKNLFIQGTIGDTTNRASKVWTVDLTTSNAPTFGAPVPLTGGGTAASLTASTGGIVYSGASALAILSGTATANLALISASSAAPVWSANALENNTSGIMTLSGTGTESGARTISGTRNFTGGKIGFGAAPTSDIFSIYRFVSNAWGANDPTANENTGNFGYNAGEAAALMTCYNFGGGSRCPSEIWGSTVLLRNDAGVKVTLAADSRLTIAGPITASGLDTASTGTAIIIDGSNIIRPLTSSEKFKSVIQRGWTLTDKQRSDFLALSPITFNYDSDTGKKDPVLGFSAEEIAASKIPFLLNYDAKGAPYSIREHAFIAYLMDTVKNQEARIKVLESR